MSFGLTTRTRTRKFFRGSPTALVIFIVAACGPSNSNHQPGADVSPPPRASTQAPDPVDEAKRSAVDIYRGMWLSYAEAATTSDWQSPRLGQFATGTALSTMTRGLYGDHYKGVVSRGLPILNPSVSSVEPAEAPTRIVVADCGDSTNWTRHYADSGEPADDEPGGKRHINAVVEKQVDGSWKVVEFGVQEIGTC